MNPGDILRDRDDIARQLKQDLQRLLQRSATDAAFRRKLLEDPRAAIEEFTGSVVPPDFDLKFIESHADATIVLPKFVRPDPNTAGEELNGVQGQTDPGLTNS